VRPKRPTAGKEKPGITISGVNDGRDPEPTNRVNVNPGSVCGGTLIQSSLRGSPATAGLCARRSVVFLVVQALIDETECVCIPRNRMSGILQVRVCGEGAG
jgi:hypothetical protein